MDQIYRYMVKDENIRLTFVSATEVCKKIAKQNGHGFFANMIFSKAVAGAILLAAQTKSGQKTGLLFRGNGLLGNIYIESDYFGRVRGYVANPNASFDPQKGDTINDGIGRDGNLQVTESAKGQKSPHNSIVGLVSGDVSEEITNYLLMSRQVNCVTNIDADIDSSGMVTMSKGFILEIMQDVHESSIDQLRKNVRAAPSITDFFTTNTQPDELVEKYLENFKFERVESESHIDLHCSCSDDMVYKTLKMLGKNELSNLLDGSEKKVIRCEMCGKKYEYSQRQLKFVYDNTEKK